jgi:hypothetical protein
MANRESGADQESIGLSIESSAGPEIQRNILREQVNESANSIVVAVL